MKFKNEKILELLINKEANLNEVSKDGNTVLHFAAMEGHSEIAGFLIEIGASVNAKNLDGQTPLYLAAKSKQYSTLKLLIKNRANVDELCPDLSALHIAAVNGDEELAKIVIDNKADLNIKTATKGETPLLHAISNHQNVADLLIRSGGDVNLSDKNWIPLTKAIDYNKTECVRHLIEKEADLNMIDPKGWTPIKKAILKDNLDILRLLIDKGADVNLSDGNWTPLNLAVHLEKIECVRFLIEKGADLNMQDLKRWTPLQRAIFKNNLEILRLLISKGAGVNFSNEDWTPLTKAIDCDKTECVRLLIEKGADLNMQGPKGLTPMQLAIIKGNLEISKFYKNLYSMALQNR